MQDHFQQTLVRESLDQAAKMVQTKIEERIAREGNTKLVAYKYRPVHQDSARLE